MKATCFFSVESVQTGFFLSAELIDSNSQEGFFVNLPSYKDDMQRVTLHTECSFITFESL